MTTRDLRNTKRRTFIRGAIGAALAIPALASAPRGARAAQTDIQDVNGPFFIVLLSGIYKPVTVGSGPDLGLSVNLNDGTWVVTQIYPVFGITNPGGILDQDKPIGNFYGSPPANLVVHQLPGGNILEQFTPPFTFDMFTSHPDGNGGFYLDGTSELKIVEANGIYSNFAPNGHNHMVDRLHQLNTGEFDEFCFCNISAYPYP